MVCKDGHGSWGIMTGTWLTFASHNRQSALVGNVLQANFEKKNWLLIYLAHREGLCWSAIVNIAHLNVISCDRWRYCHWDSTEQSKWTSYELASQSQINPALNIKRLRTLSLWIGDCKFWTRQMPLCWACQAPSLLTALPWDIVTFSFSIQSVSALFNLYLALGCCFPYYKPE